MRNKPDKPTPFLRNDETILWEGRPSDISLLEAPYTFKVMICWVVSGLLIVFGCWYLSISSVGASSPQIDHWIIGCIAIVVGIYLLCIPFVSINRLKNKTHYYITNQRFVAYCDNGSTMTCTYRELTNMTEITIETIGKNRYNIYIGTMDKKLRSHTRDPISNYMEEQKMLPLSFHSVSNAYNCTDVLPDYISIHRNTQASRQPHVCSLAEHR